MGSPPPPQGRAARAAFGAAGFAAGRYRLISGRALDVLPRLADGAYDLVFCDADRQEYPDYLAAALRLLRPGGVVAFDNALASGKLARGAGESGAERDDAARGGPADTVGADTGDPEAVAVLQLCEQVRADDRLVPLLLPIGGGLLTAVKRG